MKTLVLDNYDSFTYNLVHLLEKVGVEELDVFRNDRITPEDAGRYDKIVLSPGPGLPSEAGILKELICICSPSKSILGVCLGHQAVAEVFGGRLINIEKVQHGVAGEVHVVKPDEYLFAGLPGMFRAGRYYSWLVDNATLPADLEVTAVDETGQIMALRHISYDVRGIQFHPESIMTEWGVEIIRNWIEYSG